MFLWFGYELAEPGFEREHDRPLKRSGSKHEPDANRTRESRTVTFAIGKFYVAVRHSRSSNFVRTGDHETAEQSGIKSLGPENTLSTSASATRTTSANPPKPT